MASIPEDQRDSPEAVRAIGEGFRRPKPEEVMMSDLRWAVSHLIAFALTLLTYVSPALRRALCKNQDTVSCAECSPVASPTSSDSSPDLVDVAEEEGFTLTFEDGPKRFGENARYTKSYSASSTKQ